MPSQGQTLRGRNPECDALDRLIGAVSSGESRALVVRGEPGVGKTALLDYLDARASGCRVERASGVQSEMELAFAGLHQLCAPMLDRLPRLPEPQHDALATAFGLSAGDPPDQFFVGLAVLTLLSEVAADQPLLCIVDDAQWLDRESARALGFAARRLRSEGVGLVFAVRDQGEGGELPGLPELVVKGLQTSAARELLDAVIRAPLDERVLDRIVAETRGNPLALLELPRGLTPAELAGGFGLPDALALSGRIEESFQRRIEQLPAESRRLLLVASAEPVGEPLLVWRAARRLGIDVDAAEPAAGTGLLEFGSRVRFRHPLARSAVYHLASRAERQLVHEALAEATDPETDPDRRAWHYAQAARGPDEEIAAELERSADRARARGGFAAAAAFLERAAQLTLDPARRAERALDAAQAKFRAGAPEAARALLAAAQTGPLDDHHQGRVQLLQGQIAFSVDRGRDVPALLLAAARRLEPLDPALAGETYRDAFNAAWYAGRLGDGPVVLDVARSVRAAPTPASPRAVDLLLQAVAVLFSDGPGSGAPMVREALDTFRSEPMPTDERLRWLWLGCRAAHDIWYARLWRVLGDEFVGLARQTGALSVLPHALAMRAGSHAFAGEFTQATALWEEESAINRAMGVERPSYLGLLIPAWRGREAELQERVDASMSQSVTVGEGQWLTLVEWSRAVLYNGLARYEDALAAAVRAVEDPLELGLASWALPELIEAAVRCERRDLAEDALRRLSAIAVPGAADWGLGADALARALLADGEDAEELYRTALDRFRRAGVDVVLARTHLLYGEWLRRERRRTDARDQLGTAHALLSAMGADAFAERAAHELQATGASARRRTADTSDRLTPQEMQIARLARDGLTNPEIAARLFISPRTVEYHLHKVFGKLSISSRNDLTRALDVDAAQSG